jgi:peptidoglycan/xylan/chitin deacetylase (PgdA/CDA1 family)
MILAPVFYILVHFVTSLLPQNAIVASSNKPSIQLNKRYIYLSFDDGPLSGTSNCIDVCFNERTPATFFEVGMHQAKSAYTKRQFRRILHNDSLFVLANHSYSHAYSEYLYFYRNPKMAFNDFLRAKSKLAFKNNIVRLPGNNAWNTAHVKYASNLVKPLVRKLDSAGFNIIGWDVEWKFNQFGRPLTSPQYVFKMIDSAFIKRETRTRNHLVLLMHDYMFGNSVDSMKLVKMIGMLKSNPNYELRKLSEYPGLINGGR